MLSLILHLRTYITVDVLYPQITQIFQDDLRNL